jgi:N-methylhydantoinase A
MGIDVGGTFTDFVLLDRASGHLDYHKEPSTPSDPAAAIAAGANAIIAKAGADPADIELVVHGTTIGLNAILQRRGARIALVVSPGNQDILEIARVHMADSYDFFAVPEVPLASRDHVLELGARLDVRGSVVAEPSDSDYALLADRLRKSEVDAVAVVLINAYANSAFEIDVAARLGGLLDMPVVASTETWSEVREYERAMVAVMNAAVTPIMRAYYDRLGRNLEGQGIAAPISITTSNGGSVDIKTAYERPIDSLLSGPASGVVAAIEAARSVGIDRIVTFDMGGTSADVAVAESREPEITTHTMLGEIPLILPVVNVGAIGAGGGSIVRVDDSGFLKVGPTSAGAVPGPACFGKGGTEATIADCYLLCGFLDPETFAGGTLPLFRDLAEAALRPIADRLGYDGPDAVERAADAALRVASSMMATEVRKALARRGSDPADFALVPYGGAGPTHAALLADEAGIDRILVAARPGTFCALGAAGTNLRRDFVSSCRLSFGRDDVAARAELARLIDGLGSAGARWAADLGGRAEHWRRQIAADLRYPDQAFDLTVTLHDVAPGEDFVGRLIEQFHVQHERLYGFNEPASGVEMSRIVLSSIGQLHHPEIQAEQPVRSPDRPGRRVFLNGERYEARVVDRSSIFMSEPVDGPAVIEQADTTIVVPAGWRAERLASASLLMSRLAEGNDR